MAAGMADFAFGSIRPNYELRGCVANTVAPSNTQERLHAVKRALPTVKFSFMAHQHYRD
jgi:hypothetical protein